MTADQQTESYTEATAEQVEQEQKKRRSLWGLFGIVGLIIIVIIILLLLRNCGGGGTQGSEAGGRTIEPVENHQPSEGVISVWISDEVDIDAALGTAGVESSGRVDMGEGRFVVDVPAGTEDSAVKALADVRGVYDAGRVYER